MCGETYFTDGKFGETRIPRDMCAGKHASRGNTNPCDTGPNGTPFHPHVSTEEEVILNFGSNRSSSFENKNQTYTEKRHLQEPTEVVRKFKHH